MLTNEADCVGLASSKGPQNTLLCGSTRGFPEVVLIPHVGLVMLLDVSTGLQLFPSIGVRSWGGEAFGLLVLVLR